MTDSTIWDNGVEGPPGPPGPSIELQTSATHIQWRVTGTTTWNDLVPLSELEGPEGNGTQGPRGPTGPRGAPGTNGTNGTDGADGEDGAPGPAIELQVTATHIEWRVVGDVDWIELIALSELQGEQGPAGEDGTDGTDGTDGASAYEVAVANGFVGTEAEWLESLEGPQGPAGTGSTINVADDGTTLPAPISLINFVGATVTDNEDGTVTVEFTGGGGSGDVVGPSDSVDNELALFDGTTGKIIKRGPLISSLATSTALSNLADEVGNIGAALDAINGEVI